MDDNTNHALDLPPEACHYNLRIGGHTHVQGKLKLGMLKHKNGHLLKPLLNGDVRSTRELSFYQQVHGGDMSDHVLRDLKMFIPLFHGLWETTIDGSDIKYLCIEDVCGIFEKPSVLDVKIGPITYDAFATQEKIDNDTKKYPSVTIFGFRILGMKVFDSCNQQYSSLNKAFGKSLTTPEAVTGGLGKFFHNKLGQINCIVLSGFLHKLLWLKNWFLKQRKFAFISSSILFVYEGNLSLWITWIKESCMHIKNSDSCKYSGEFISKESISLHYMDCSPVFQNPNAHSEQNFCSDCYLHKDICNELQKNCSLYRVSMLDFAHVFPTSEEDSNYLFGLNSLILYWQKLLKISIEAYF